MSYHGTLRGQVIWEKEDFTKHGMIATYYFGECRCPGCIDRWESWTPTPKEWVSRYGQIQGRSVEG